LSSSFVSAIIFTEKYAKIFPSLKDGFVAMSFGLFLLVVGYPVRVKKIHFLNQAENTKII